MNEKKSEIITVGRKNFFGSKWFRLAAVPVLIGLIMTAVFLWSCFRKTSAGDRTGYNPDDFRREVNSLKAGYDARNRELYDRFRRDIAVAGEADFRKALNNIDGTVGSFGTVKNCWKLVFAMARDQIKRSGDAGNMIVEVIRKDILLPCAAGTAEAEDILNDFIHRLQENHNRFRSEIALKTEKLPAGYSGYVPAEKLISDLDRIQEQINILVTETVLTSICFALEAAMIRQTLAAAGRIAGRVASGLAVSIGSPLLDGPLPVGDIIGCAGFGWCVWDIYRIKKLLPERLGESLRDSIVDYRNSCRQEFLEAGRKVWEAGNRYSTETVQAIN